jgi:hypothetical protein
MGLCDDVRAACSEGAAEALHMRVDEGALDTVAAGWGAVDEPALDPERHFLDGSRDDVAAYVLTLSAINFGSGWFPALRKRIGPGGRPVSGYFTVAMGLTERFRSHGPWSAAELRGLTTPDVAEVLGQPADHELMALYSQALRSLGVFLGERTPLQVVEGAGGSAERLATELAGGMAMFADHGFFKRAQITGSDLALAGVADFADLDRLTIFADNLVPHVLRCDGVLVYEPELAALVDSGALLAAGRREREIRASAVHACELLAARLNVAPRVLDHWLWNRGQATEYKARPRHRCRTVFY